MSSQLPAGGPRVGPLDRFQRRHPVIGLPLAVVYKFVDDQGAYLAALITYYGLLSIFPLALLLVSVLGFVIQNNAGLREQVLDGVLSQLPVLGEDLQSTQGLQGSVTAIVIGLLAASYGGLGVAQALQHAMNTAWGVPRNQRPNPFLARAKSALVLFVMFLSLAAMAVVPALLPVVPGWLWNIATVLAAVLAFWVVMAVSTHESTGRWALLPGASVVGLAWRLMERGGAELVTRVSERSATYGVFAVVLGIIVWIYLFSAVVVLAAELNVVVARHLYPRALLTPFTDRVSLTQADVDAYTQLATMQRLKGFQQVDVTFDRDGDGIPDPPAPTPRTEQVSQR